MRRKDLQADRESDDTPPPVKKTSRPAHPLLKVPGMGKVVWDAEIGRWVHYRRMVTVG